MLTIKNFLPQFLPFTLGRRIDLSVQSNRFVFITSVFWAIINFLYLLLRHTLVQVSLWYGLLAGLTVFLAWALAREIDPDHPRSANIALVFTAVLFPLPPFQIPKLMLLFTLLLCSRLVNNSTGKKVTIFDWIIISFLLVTHLGEFQFIVNNWFVSTNIKWSVTVFVATIIIALTIISQPQIKSKDDMGKHFISKKRVQIASSLLLIFATLKGSISGIPGFSHLYPLWISFAAMLMVRILNRKNQIRGK